MAAAIHLSLLDPDRIPSASEILGIPFFDKVTPVDRGKVMFVGKDAHENRVYILGRGSEKRSMEEAVKSGLRLGTGRDDTVRFVDTLQCVNGWMRLGGFLSRELKLVAIGRPLVVYGTRRAYRCLAAVVKQTMAELEKAAPGGGEAGSVKN